MDQLIQRAVKIIKHKLALEDLSERGVDVSDHLDQCEDEINFIVDCLKVVGLIAYYRRRKRWKGSLTIKQKDTIKEHIKTHNDAEIAGVICG